MLISNIEDILDFLEGYYVKGENDLYDDFKILLDNDIIKNTRIGEIHDNSRIKNIFWRLSSLYSEMLDLPVEQHVIKCVEKWLDELWVLTKNQ